MTAFLLLTHGAYATGIISGAEMVVGSLQDTYHLSLTEEGIDSFRELLYETLERIQKEYQEIIILTDIANATPYNEAYRYVLSEGKKNTHLVAGINLPIFIEMYLSITGSETPETKKCLSDAIWYGKEAIELVDFNV